MSPTRAVTRPTALQGILRAGLCIGIAGGLAEIGVVWLYSVLKGENAAVIARHVAAAIGLGGASASVGVAVHMVLAVALGICLSAMVQIVAGRHPNDSVLFTLMPGSLAIVWAINFFIVLPEVSPEFVLLLPYGVTLTSKLAFGFCAALSWRTLMQPTRARSVRLPARYGQPA
jgi:hypothetical protein